MSDIPYVYVASFFSVLDISLTHYQLFLIKKKKVKRYAEGELNFWARFLMIKTNLHPMSIIIGSIIPQAIIWGSVMVFNYTDFPVLITGALIIANLIHYYNLKQLHHHWNDKKFWTYMNRRNIHGR